MEEAKLSAQKEEEPVGIEKGCEERTNVAGLVEKGMNEIHVVVFHETEEKKPNLKFYEREKKKFKT